MIIFKFQEKEYSFSGYNTEASFDGEILFINGDMTDFQFAIEIPGNEIGIYTKKNTGTSISFDLPNGDSYSAYSDDGLELSSIELDLRKSGIEVAGSFKGKLIGEEPDQPFDIEGNFSVQIQ